MKDFTTIATAGLDPFANHGIVNPPVYHASTILFPTLSDWKASRNPDFQGVRYGRFGTPTTFALQDAVTEIGGGYRSIAVASGAGAVCAVLMSFADSGDHILVADTVYGPTRRLCEDLMSRFAIETTFYDPMIGAGIAELMRPNTKLVFLESPGTITFEVSDVPAITAAAHAGGAVTAFDNTWASPLYFKPFEHDIDVSISAATKYISGHSDVMLGVISMTEETYPTVRRYANMLGGCPGPDDCYLALRGLRSLGVRMPRHQESALALAHWLEERSEISRVMHPALPDHPGHGFWKRDYLGSSGLFGFILKSRSERALAAMVDGMKLIHMGASWGGFESLFLPAQPATMRSATVWDDPGQVLRLHVGLEDVDDLIADLEAGFERLKGAS
jgi:cystathionine beta-lyase